MDTIDTLAAEYGMQPFELHAYADLDVTDYTAPLPTDTVTFIRDLIDNSVDGVYMLRSAS